MKHETLRFLEKTADDSFGRSDKIARTQFGFDRLELYLSRPIAVWLEGFPEKDLVDFLAGDLFECVTGAESFVSANLPDGIAMGIQAAWSAQAHLIEALRRHSQAMTRVSPTLLALFFSAMVLRISFNTWATGGSLQICFVDFGSGTLAPSFIELVKAKALRDRIPLPLDLSNPLETELPNLTVKLKEIEASILLA